MTSQLRPQLRPLSLGEILDQTAALYRGHFPLFAGISAIFAAAMLAMRLLYVGGLSLLGYPHIPPHLEWAFGTMVAVQSLVIVIVAGLSVVANNRAVAWVYLGHPATVSSAVGSVFPRLRRYLWLMIVTGLRAWGPLAAFYIAMMGIAFAMLPAGWLTNPGHVQPGPVQNPEALMVAALSMLVLVLLILLATVYGVWMSLRYALAVPACVVEEVPTGPSIKRSIELSKGSRGRILVLGLLVYAVRLILGILLGFPAMVYSFKHVGHPLPLGMMVFTQIAAFLIDAFIGPIYATGLTLFYYDQRIRKEGYDIEWMMQAAGLTQQAASPEPQQV